MTEATKASEVAERLEAAAEGRRYGVTSDLFNEAAAFIRAQSERERVLVEAFSHYHVGPGDKCKQCGFDLRDRIHIRMGVQS